MDNFKKLLRWFLVAVLAIVVLFGVLCFTMPATKFTTTFEVDKPVEACWDAVMDDTRATEWLPGLASIELIEGEHLKPGSRFKMTFEQDGTEFIMEEEVIAVIEHQRFEFALTSDYMDSDVVMRFEANGDKTKVTTDNVVRGNGVLRPLVPLMKGQMVDMQNDGYARLKAIVEKKK